MAASLIDHSPVEPTSKTRAHHLVLTLLVILLLNFGIRCFLDKTSQTVPSFLETAYPEQLATIHNLPWWRYLLPIRELTGSWSTTGLLAVHGLEHLFGQPHYVYYFNNGLMITAAFLLSWSIFRSYWFSTTLALCFAFTTFNHHVYCVSGAVVMPLIVTYLLCFLFCQYKLLKQESSPRVWVPLGILSLLVYMLSYEGWLDCFVYMCLAYPLVIGLYYQQKDWRRVAIASSILTVTALFALGYVAVKATLGHGQVEGSESDVVFNYHGADRLVAVEDVISQYFTIFYIAVSNYLPPQLFVNSVSWWKFGNEHLIELQKGYHAQFSQLVVYNHVFLWRYYAGFALALFCFLFWSALRSAYTTRSPHAIAFALFLLMVLTAGPTHMLVKWRPMHAVPTLGYHAYFGVVGMSLLLAYVAHYVTTEFSCRRVGYSLIVLIWLTLGYGALARPAMLSHMNAVVGFPPYPDAMKELKRSLRHPMGKTIKSESASEFERL